MMRHGVSCRQFIVETEFRTDMAWIMDLRHSLTDDLLPPPGRVGKRAAYLGKMVAAATARGVGNPFCSAITCSRRPGRKPCKGKLMLLLHKDGNIRWECESCDYQGLLSGWQDTMWDLRKAKRVDWYENSLVFDVSDEEYRILTSIATSSINSRAVIAGAMTTPDEILIVARKEIMRSLARDVELAAKNELNKKKRLILEAIRDRAKESMEVIPPSPERAPTRNSPTYH